MAKPTIKQDGARKGSGKKVPVVKDKPKNLNKKGK